MTDNEIIKALECCTNCICNHAKTDTECPLVKMSFCKNYLMKESLALINRQKEDIEHYKKSYFNGQKIFSDQSLENECMKAEIDSMKEKLKLYSYYKEPFVKHIKSEAIKDSSEKLKEAPIKMGIPLLGLQTKSEIEEYFNGILLQLRDAIDDLVKEMTGEKT